MSKELIAVDLDDVLSMHHEALAAFMAKAYGAQHPPEVYKAGSYAVLWGVDEQTATDRMWRFSDAGLHTGYDVKPGAVEAITHLQEDYDLAIVTQRVKAHVEDTYQWLEQYFPKTFKHVSFLHAFEGDTRTKADICREIGASYLIDDNLKHCQLAAAAGIVALWFGHDGPLPDEVREPVVPVKDWSEVVEYFDSTARLY